MQSKLTIAALAAILVIIILAIVISKKNTAVVAPEVPVTTPTVAEMPLNEVTPPTTPPTVPTNVPAGETVKVETE